jgi:uncharacterized protein (DUF3084 family)
MINSTLYLFLQLQVVCLGYAFSENIFILIVPVTILGTILLIYFLMDNSKKNFAFKEDALMREIRKLKLQCETQADELKALNIKLEEDETQYNVWKEEKTLLIEENESLKKQIKNSLKIESAEKDDIIIEYYLNEKSGS